jgi:hypothetical protein
MVCADATAGMQGLNAPELAQYAAELQKDKLSVGFRVELFPQRCQEN